MSKLLTRDDFRNLCLARDQYKCVYCNKTESLSVHHIVERKLFSQAEELGGYFLDNGASLCEECHLKAEQTILNCDEIRKAAGITNVILPDHLELGNYTKWGDFISEDGERSPGEMFHEENVQRILKTADVLHLYKKLYKYPRTFHLPWSLGKSNDDKVMTDISGFEGRDVVVTAKCDGENTSMYNDYLHARSLTYKSHDSRSYVKQIHASICQDIPEGWRICGENCFAEHSIHYNNLPGYFLVFSIWNHYNICLAWDETVEWASLLGLPTVPVLYRGTWNEKLIRGLYTSELNGDPCEGYVVRLSCSFHYKNFKTSVAKVVRAGHVTTDEHWLEKQVVPNQLKR